MDFKEEYKNIEWGIFDIEDKGSLEDKKKLKAFLEHKLKLLTSIIEAQEIF